MEKVKTKQQKRAEFALEKLTTENGTVDHKLAQFIIGLPTMILTNGLAQTFAFILSKKKKEPRYSQTFDMLKEWLQKDMADKFAGVNSNLDFIKKFNEMSAKDYIAAQDECLRLVEWLKRYAKAFDQAEEKG